MMALDRPKDVNCFVCVSMGLRNATYYSELQPVVTLYQGTPLCMEHAEKLFYQLERETKGLYSEVA